MVHDLVLQERPGISRARMRGDQGHPCHSRALRAIVDQDPTGDKGCCLCVAVAHQALGWVLSVSSHCVFSGKKPEAWEDQRVVQGRNLTAHTLGPGSDQESAAFHLRSPSAVSSLWSRCLGHRLVL